MIKKLAYLGAIVLLISSIISCEKDFTDIGTNVINNGSFDANIKTFEIALFPKSTNSVRADNIAIGALGEYWLGVYNNKNYKKIEGSIVSQVGYLPNLSSKETDGDTVFTLNRVVLKLPYQSVSLGKKDGLPAFRLDSILGSGATSVKVYKNNTYLNRLNPLNPTKLNKYLSNAPYQKDISVGVLNENENFTFEPKATDTIFTSNITRKGVLIGRDTIVNLVKKVKTPFLAIPLNVAKMKSIFWDKFNSEKFSSKSNFDDYFRGLIIEAKGENGSLVPLKLSRGSSLEFLYSKNVIKNNKVDTVIRKRHSFSLSGIKNSVYKMTSGNPTPSNSFAIQGTAGSSLDIKILTDEALKELRAKNWLINDASLTFYVNQAVNKDTATVPQRLFLYKNLVKGTNTIPVQISDAYREASFFGGKLKSTNKKPEKYTIRITDYISKVIKGKQPNSLLSLKVFNPTDVAISNKKVDTIVKSYNWNPRGVTLLNNLPSNGNKRAVLKIAYTEKK